mmetsp:Transcript_24398/g.36381  ORF Transcript_24398/g.36381 Transcript_24398/m.36381 type:complete len:120 (-) Transcript_24398:454-813(-)
MFLRLFGGGVCSGQWIVFGMCIVRNVFWGGVGSSCSCAVSSWLFVGGVVVGVGGTVEVNADRMDVVDGDSHMGDGGGKDHLGCCWDHEAVGSSFHCCRSKDHYNSHLGYYSDDVGVDYY